MAVFPSSEVVAALSAHTDRTTVTGKAARSHLSHDWGWQSAHVAVAVSFGPVDCRHLDRQLLKRLFVAEGGVPL
jgi:hypothetical protein